MAELDGIEVRGAVEGRAREILTPEALAFVARLQREFGPTRERLLAARVERQRELDAGVRPGFLAETRQIRESD
jgi:malate synthase